MDADKDIRISASQVAACMGLSPWQTPLELYLELRGEVTPRQSADPELLEEGREFETAIMRIGRRKAGLQEWSPPYHRVQRGYVMRHPSLPLQGHADGFGRADGVTMACEAKHTLFGGLDMGDGWGTAGSDEVPEHYAWQLRSYVGLHAALDPRAADYGYVFARLHHGVTVYRVGLSADQWEAIASAVLDMRRRVFEGDPPPLQDPRDVSLRWLADARHGIEASEPVLAQLRTLRDLGAARRAIEKQEADLKLALVSAAQDAGYFFRAGPTGPVRVASLAGLRVFDREAFTNDHPDLAAQYQTLDTSRLRAEQRDVYDRYMREPINVAEQTRRITLLRGLD